MNHRVSIFLLLVLPPFALIGCHQNGPTHLAPGDWTPESSQPEELKLVSHQAHANIERPKLSVVKQTKSQLPLFSTVNSSDLKKRKISLSECIALAAENGRLGGFFDGAGRGRKTSVASFVYPQPPGKSTDSIRVLAFDPAIAATNVDESLTRFDTWAETGLFWNRIDQPSRLLAPGSPFEEFSNRNKLDDVNFETGFFKRLAIGGVAGVQFRTAHERNFVGADSQILDPSYRPGVAFFLEQPLLQGAGAFINQVRDTHPRSIRRILPDPTQPPGILLVRLSHRQSELEFARQTQELIYRVEEAYWQLYCAYWDLYSSDNGMKQAHAAWQIAKARYDAGGIGVEDLAMIEEQYHFFRNQRLQALGQGISGRPGVLEAERRLRYVVGLPAEDGTRLIPDQPPGLVLYEPDLAESIAVAQFHRPELKQVDAEIEIAHLNIAKAEDRILPDLRFVSRYGINSLDGAFAGGLQGLVANPRHEWEVGLRLQYPIGARAAHAEMARAQLQLAQKLAFLKDQKEKLIFSLVRSYRELTQFREQYRVRRSQRIAAAKQLAARYAKFKAGGDPKEPGSFIDLLLRAQRNWADAIRGEHIALCNYRISIADFERQKGTICAHANVALDEEIPITGVHSHASEYMRHWHQRASHADEAIDNCATHAPERAAGLVPAGITPAQAGAAARNKARPTALQSHATLGVPRAVTGSSDDSPIAGTPLRKRGQVHFAGNGP